MTILKKIVVGFKFFFAFIAQNYIDTVGARCSFCIVKLVRPNGLCRLQSTTYPSNYACLVYDNDSHSNPFDTILRINIPF